MSLELMNLALTSKFPCAEHKLVALAFADKPIDLMRGRERIKLARFANISLERLDACLDALLSDGMIEYADGQDALASISEPLLRALAAGRVSYAQEPPPAPPGVWSLEFASEDPEEDRRKQPIPAIYRLRVFERDGYRCKHCGSSERLRADHIFPESRGGRLELSNLQTLCVSCNSRKGATIPEGAQP